MEPWSRVLRHLGQALRVAAEVVTYVCGLGALIVVVRQVTFLLHYVTLGPLPLPFPGSSEGTAVYHLFDALGLAGGFHNAAWLGGVVLVCAAFVLARRIRSTWGSRTSATVIQVATLLAVLAWSYRFAGLIAAVALTIWLLWRPVAGWRKWAAWAIVVALSVVPYDMTCRNLEGPARLEPAIPCSTEFAIAEYAANRRVCMGSDSLMYNEPSALWVW